MRHPTIHLNGTSKKSLLDGYHTAYLALRAAQAALVAITPHGRDYYPQGEGAIHEALKEHRENIMKVYEVSRDIEAHVQHIFDTYSG